MEKTILIHVGTHKTGTTTLQTFLRTQARPLRKRGVYIPRSGTTGPHDGHHNLAWELRGDDRFSAGRGRVRDLIAELDGVAERKAIVSSEDFEYLVHRPDALTGFHERLLSAGWTPVYMVTFRRPDEYALSLYLELRNHGLERSFAGFCLDVLRKGFFAMKGGWVFYFDYREFRRRWPYPLNAFVYEELREESSILLPALELLDVPSRRALVERESRYLNWTAYRGVGRLSRFGARAIGLRYRRAYRDAGG